MMVTSSWPGPVTTQPRCGPTRARWCPLTDNSSPPAPTTCTFKLWMSEWAGEGVSPIEREWHSMVPSMVIPNCHPIQIDHKILAFSRLTDESLNILNILNCTLVWFTFSRWLNYYWTTTLVSWCLQLWSCPFSQIICSIICFRWFVNMSQLVSEVDPFV